MAQQEEIKKIDIVRLIQISLRTVKKFWHFMLIVIVVMSAGGFLYVSSHYVPMYESQATFSVSVEARGTELANSSNQVKESLPYILNSSHIKNLVKNDLGLDYFPAAISVKSGDYADYYILTVSSDNPQMSYDILNSLLEHCPEISRFVLGNMNMYMVDMSGVPTEPVNYRNPKQGLILGAMAGVLACLVFAGIYVLTNKTVQTEEDLKNYTSVSCLASIPKVVIKKRGKAVSEQLNIYNELTGYAFLENVRAMRARVQRSMEHLNAKTVMVTSSIPQEGKSTLSVNLALALAEVGYRVVLVDLDLRNPSIDQVLGFETHSKEGVTQILKGEKKLAEQLSVIKEWNLTVLHAGEPQNNPLELLGKASFPKMMQQLRRKYDYIVLDTPPSAILSDATAIAKCADCAIYIVKQDYTRIERIVEGMELLNVSQVPIAGVVLNGTERGMSGYASYRYGNYYAAKKIKASETTGEYTAVKGSWEEEKDEKELGITDNDD